MPLTAAQKEMIISRLIYQIMVAETEVPELIMALRKVLNNIEEEHKIAHPLLVGKDNLKKPYVRKGPIKTESPGDGWLPPAARPGFFG
jgi:hypothetical protein